VYRNPGTFVTERLRKIQALRDLGVDPYPQQAYSPTHTIPQVLADADRLIETEGPARVAGRIVACRSMGKVIFIDLLDGGEKLQIFVYQSDLLPSAWEAVTLLDLGDFLGVEGPLFRTRSGQLSVRSRSLTVLAKATHPIPLPKQRGDQLHAAVTRREVLHCHRHIDTIANRGSREVFVKRTAILRGVRHYLDAEGFLEVETPILGAAYGGASARPFLTHGNALDEAMFLRISPECSLKRWLVAGFNRVYELGKNFRNEGIDASHNPEFTMVEWYEAYSDYLEQMTRFETLVAGLCEQVNRTTRIAYRGRPLDLTPPWRRLPMIEAIGEYAGLDMGSTTVNDMPEVFRRHHPGGLDALPQPLTWGAAVTELFEALVEPHLWDPVFVMDHPLEISPLTKAHRRDPRLVERFEPMIAGMEVGNSYTELNDPVEQYQRLTAQQMSREQAYDMDYEFLLAMAHGMPPAGGTGLGVDRIVMILTGAASIRDVIFLPLTSHGNVKAMAVGPAGG
jgi:lysyl-tRNA synthetase class 2